MRSIYSYITNCTTSLLLCSLLFACGENEVMGNGNEEDIELTQAITFAVDEAETRASNLVESMTGKNFSVVAYQYKGSTTWTKYKATAAPDKTSFPACPIAVNYSNGVWDYDNDGNAGNGTEHALWNKPRKYSFYAFHPQPHAANTKGTLQFKENYSNDNKVASITYTIPTSESTKGNGKQNNPKVTTKSIDFSNTEDILISGINDVMYQGDGTVKFNFRHCLCRLEIVAKNYLTTKSQYLKSITLGLNSDSGVYTTAEFALDGSATNKSNKISSTNVVRSGTTYIQTIVNYDINTNGLAIASSGSAQLSSNDILLIPQTEAFNAKLNFYIGDTQNTATKQQTVDVAYSGGFEAGKSYAIMVNIISNNTITATIEQTGDEWIDEYPDITFE